MRSCEETNNERYYSDRQCRIVEHQVRALLCARYTAPSPARTIDRIGALRNTILYSDPTTGRQGSRSLEPADRKSAGAFLVDWLDRRRYFADIRAIGHRVVFGMNFTETQPVSPISCAGFESSSCTTPTTCPAKSGSSKQWRPATPKFRKFLCFYTAFHRTLPRVAKLLPIPRRYAAQGVVRYRFHGLSCAYLMEEIERIAGPSAAAGRIILAHLGSGASLTAMKTGYRSIPPWVSLRRQGFPWRPRPGDLDPGVILYLLRKERLSPEQCGNLINRECGLYLVFRRRAGPPRPSRPRGE